jgi:hypothetical protein
MRDVPTLLKTETPWPEYEREIYRLRDRHLSAKLVTTFASRGCHVWAIKISLTPRRN